MTVAPLRHPRAKLVTFASFFRSICVFSVTSVTIALPVLLAACQSPQPVITTITIGPEVLHTHVKRFGINLSGQSFYDSGQMLRNLTFRNPGFEGETWQSILHCKTVTPTTCTDENQYAVWPANFLAGAHYELISGPSRGSSGTVVSSSVATADRGVTLTLVNPPKPPTTGDFLLVRIEKPGKADAGWWTSLQSGASLSTEFHDLSPNTPGKQALRIDASAPGSLAAISSYFDSFNGRSFLQLHAQLTLGFRAKSLNSNSAIQVDLQRLDTSHGRQIFFSKSVPLSNNWRDYTFTFPADDIPGAVGTVGLTFTVANASILLDDVALTTPAAPDNPTAFRNEVVQTLRDLRPGVLRYMDNGTNFGSSLDNLLAPPFARQRTGASTQSILQEDISIGLNEFLQLAKAASAEPWYSMPPGTSPAEAAALVQFLSGPASSHYGAIRAALGQPRPWTEVFPTIHLELGNEQWNHQSFAGSTINDPTAYGQRAAQVFSAIRSAPGFNAARFDLILGSWASVPWWTQQEIASSSAFDSVAVAPYLFNNFDDASSTESIFGPMLAQPEAIDSRPTGYMAQQARALAAGCEPQARGQQASPSSHSCTPRLAVYEVNIAFLPGSAQLPQADLDRTVPSLGAGLAVADHMLLMLRDLGVTTQCLFALPEYENNFSAPGAHRMIPLWGAVVDMGGPTNLRRPQFLAEQLINQALLPNELATQTTGPANTWNQTESPNDTIKLAGAHLLQTFAFADGSHHTLILLNLSRTDYIPVTFSGGVKPSRPLEETVLTASKVTDSNESTSTIAPIHKHLPNFDPAASHPLPPFSITILDWRQ
jgi:hypothetical protein